jgi:hypothetical protein
MSLDSLDSIAAPGTDRITGEIVLTVVDWWDGNDEHAHRLSLEARLNAYLAFVESEQIGEVELVKVR